MIDGHKLPNVSDGEQGIVRENAVGSDYFHTLGVPILDGRDFTDADTARAPRSPSSTRHLQSDFCPDRIRHWSSHLTDWRSDYAQIVGVVKDHKYTGIDGDTRSHALVARTRRAVVGEKCT